MMYAHGVVVVVPAFGSAHSVQGRVRYETSEADTEKAGTCEESHRNCDVAEMS